MEFNVSLKGRLCAQASLSNSTQVLGITGPSGAGKSSLLRALAGFEPNAVVSVDWLGDNVAGNNVEQKATHNLRRSPSSNPKKANPNNVRVGLVFQEPMLFPHIDVNGNLLLAQRHAGPKAVTLSQALEGCECAHLRYKPIHALSGGEAQRVAIARALVNGPDILLLDESLSALNTSLRSKILRFLVNTCVLSGMKLLIVSHHLEDLALFSDEMLVMNEGKVSAAGAVANVMGFIASHESIENPCAVLEGIVVPPSNDFPYPFTRINVAGSILYAKATGAHVYKEHVQRLENKDLKGENSQDKARIVVFANEVSIDINAHASQPTSSMLNALPCEIVNINSASSAPHHPTAIIELSHEKQTLYARVSTLSIARLKLTPGLGVTARFKLQ